MSIDRNKNGNRYVVFKPALGLPHKELKLPCGRCIGCRLEYSRQWAMRCVHEASLYESNSFLTLTYNDENLPPDGSLDKSHFQKFMKRFRKLLDPHKIRFFGCGEYGTSCLTCGKNENDCNKDLSHVFIETFGRPHFHACIFNYDFPDKQPYSKRDGVVLYTSEILQKLWPFGFVTIGDVTFESAAYVARYVTKKITGDLAETHYSRHCSYTGELYSITPEFPLMSRNPGIARDWYETYNGDLEKDFLTLRGNIMRPPKYYDYLLHKTDEVTYDLKKSKRKKAALLQAHDNTRARLDVKEKIKLKKFTQLPRGLTQ